MENLGDIDRQTLAGAISTATHGTGARLSQPLGAGRGSRAGAGGRERDRGVRARRSRGLPRRSRGPRRARGHLLGHAPDRARVLDAPRGPAAAARGDPGQPSTSSPARNEHFEFFVFPHTEAALVIERNRVDGPPSPRGRVDAYVNEILIENYGMDVLARIARRFPGRDPAPGRLRRRASSRTRSGPTAAIRIFASERRVRFTEMEYAIPRENGPEAVRRVLELVREASPPGRLSDRVPPRRPRRRPPQPRVRARDRLRRRPPVPGGRLGALLPGGRGDHGLLRAGAPTGESATSRPRRRSPAATRDGGTSRGSGPGSTPRGGSRTPTPTACSGPCG